MIKHKPALTPAEQQHSAKPIKVISPANDPQRPASVRDLSRLEVSRTISLARILLIVGLVFLHYMQFPNSHSWPYNGLDVTEHSVATFVNSTVFFMFLSVVPLLSMISGWLFFSFNTGDQLKTIFGRIRRRATSLYLPLVLWNACILTGLYALYKTNPHYPLLSQLNMDFDTATYKAYINGIFGLTQRPIGFQFWFVRDLFVTVLVSPIFLLALRRAPWVGAAVLGTAWLAAFPMGIFFRPDVPFFFYMGALVQMKQMPLGIPRKVAIGMAAAFVTLAAVRALAPMVVDLSAGIPEWLRVVTSLMRLVGVVGCWGLLQHWAQTKRGQRIGNYGGLAFFLHSAHWPLLAFVKIWLWPFVPSDNDFWMLAHDLACVAVTVFLGLGLGMLLNRYAPGVFAFMNGGRLLGQTKG